jgi:hypothetical protein
MAEIRINATGGVKLYDADDSHYAQIIAGTITSNTDVMTLGHAAVVMGTKLDCNGNNLILDADADTYIDGGTADDTLDIYVAGAKDFTITANTLTAQSGSTIAAQALTATTVVASGIVKTDDTTAATSTTDGSLQTDGGLSVALDGVIGDDLLMLSDASVIHFGADSEVTLTHNADKGLILKHSATADDKPVILTLQTGETDMATNDVIGKVEFQVPDEGTGTDAVLVAGAIQAVSEGAFSSSSNATRLEFMTGASEAATSKVTISSGGILGVPFGDLGVGVHVRTADAGAVTIATSADELILENGTSEAGCGMTIFSATDADGIINFADAGDVDIGRLVYNHTNNYMYITAAAAEKIRFGSTEVTVNDPGANLDFRCETGADANAFLVDAGSDFIRFFGTAGSLDSNTGNDYGLYSDNTGETVFSMNNLSCKFNRQNGDGDVISIIQEGSGEGTISVSGTTVAYNTFCGTHWSRLADNSKPTILRGTVMESIATMIDWYQVEYEIDITKEYKDGDTIPLGKEIGDEYDSKTSYKESIALPDGKSVGDNHTITVKGIERTGKIIKEGNEQLPMCKISNTADSKAVYGVFMTWDDQDDGLDGDVNDMYVASLGAFVVRVHSGETVAIGDYLQSNGDGTAKVQADDILRASTIGKVTSTEKTHTHADDSYCVPCTLHCG